MLENHLSLWGREYLQTRCAFKPLGTPFGVTYERFAGQKQNPQNEKLHGMLHSSPQEAVVQVTSAGGRQGRDLLVAAAFQIRLDLEQQVAIALNEAVGLQRFDESPGESLGCRRNLK